MAIKVSFVIATRNRPEVLQWCIRSCLAQVGIEPEILVYDDASEKPVKRILPSDLADVITVRRFERNLGQSAVRSIGYQDASHQAIVSLDDDCVLFDPKIVSEAAHLLLGNDKIGAVPLRYFERGQERAVGRVMHSDLRRNHYGEEDCSTFVGAVVLLRKDAVTRCGLYPDWIYRQGEERFLSIRLLDAGYRIVLHGPPAAIHLFSPVRDRRAMQWYEIRN
ncbi:MAG: glycosyltransferase family 2 protein, partial [Candidatus Methanomethylicaceae archaeon]